MILENKVALVTGGTSGIGKATALPFGAAGAKVVFSRRREVEGEATATLIRDAGAEYLFVRSDVSVNNASTLGLFAFPGLSPYVASKHAVMGLTRSAALDYAKQGIRINAVNPGSIGTEMNDRSLKQIGMTVDSFASTCQWVVWVEQKKLLKQLFFCVLMLTVLSILS